MTTMMTNDCQQFNKVVTESRMQRTTAYDCRQFNGGHYRITHAENDEISSSSSSSSSSFSSFALRYRLTLHTGSRTIRLEPVLQQCSHSHPGTLYRSNAQWRRQSRTGRRLAFGCGSIPFGFISGRGPHVKKLGFLLRSNRASHGRHLRDRRRMDHIRRPGS